MMELEMKMEIELVMDMRVTDPELLTLPMTTIIITKMMKIMGKKMDKMEMM